MVLELTGQILGYLFCKRNEENLYSVCKWTTANKQQKTSENNRHHHQIQFGKLVSIYTLVMIYTSSKTHTVYHNTTAKIHCIKWIANISMHFGDWLAIIFELGSWIFFSFIFLSLTELFGVIIILLFCTLVVVIFVSLSSTAGKTLPPSIVCLLFFNTRFISLSLLFFHGDFGRLVFSFSSIWQHLKHSGIVWCRIVINEGSSLEYTLRFFLLFFSFPFFCWVFSSCAVLCFGVLLKKKKTIKKIVAVFLDHLRRLQSRIHPCFLDPKNRFFKWIEKMKFLQLYYR